MKASTILAVAGALMLACCRPSDAASLLKLKDAERILGEPGQLTDSATKREAGATNYYLTYKANKEDPKSRKTGTLYFVLEDYDQAGGAQERYRFIKEANAKSGIKVLHDVGDEAYFHTDSVAFYYIMIRKGKRVLTMKVNKVTNYTSLEEFNRVARSIAAGM
jgi:hypothetical protein